MRPETGWLAAAGETGGEYWFGTGRIAPLRESGGVRLDNPMIQASLRIVAPPAKRLEVLEVLQSLQGPTEVSAGCRVCRVLQDADNDDALTYVVRWDTRQDLDEHLSSQRFRNLLPYIEMSVEPPELEISVVDPLGGIEFLVAALESKQSE